MMTLGLFEQKPMIVSRRKANQLDLLRQVIRHFYRAHPDRPGAAQKHDPFALRR
jgi:hypothetical protein